MSAWALLLLASFAAAQTAPPPDGRVPPPPAVMPPPAAPPHPESFAPPILKPIIHLIHGGLLLILPEIDTDPNRGTTVGVMPIWAYRGENGVDIREIHAPSLDYNPTFGVTGTYRYYEYPKSDARFVARGAISQVVNRELFLGYTDKSLLSTTFKVDGSATWNVDGSKRFFGLGPAAPLSNQTNYTEDILGYRVAAGHPIWGPLSINAEQTLESAQISNGPIASLPGIGEFFPQEVTSGRDQAALERLYLTYDTRDSADTTTRGIYSELSAESSQKDLFSQFDFQRYAVDQRVFWRRDGAHRLVTAIHARFEDMTGPAAPFWLEPQLGGKSTLRSYGEGRFTDRGMMLASVEERVLVYRRDLGGTPAELEIAPFLEAGTVFDTPGDFQSRYVHPAYGAAVRAIARPQIVASIDFGLGQEGLAAFMDVGYSF